jgi:hypothetical protein
MLPSFNYFKDPKFICYFRSFTKILKLSTVTEKFLNNIVKPLLLVTSTKKVKQRKQPELNQLVRH